MSDSLIQLGGVVCFAITIPVGARLAERGRRRALLAATAAIAAYGFVMAPLFSRGLVGATLAMTIGLALMGIT